MLMALVIRAKMPETVIATPSTQKPQASIWLNSASPNWPQLVAVRPLGNVELSIVLTRFFH